MNRLIPLLLLFISPLALAESIELSTGEVVDGKLIDFPKDVTIQLTDGTKKTVPYTGITSIYKKSPPQSFSPFLGKDKDADAKGEKKSELGKVDNDSFAETDPSKGPYGTPTLTFETWKKAATNDDLDGMVNCYVAYKKNDIKKGLKKLSKKTREDMKTAMIETIFTPSAPYYQGDSAIMEVSWSKGLASETQTLKFRLENSKDWKIVE